MQTKCEANLDFSFSMQMLFFQDADAKHPYDAHVLLSEMQFMMQTFSNGHVGMP